MVLGNNTEKAKKLYETCETNPELHTLFPMKYFGVQKDGVFYSMVVGNLINHYSMGNYEDDWIPLSKKTFHIHAQDEEGWTLNKNIVHKLQKKELVETMMKDNQNYIRISTDIFYDDAMYKRED